jgi:hypothetical protein
MASQSMWHAFLGSTRWRWPRGLMTCYLLTTPQTTRWLRSSQPHLPPVGSSCALHLAPWPQLRQLPSWRMGPRPWWWSPASVAMSTRRHLACRLRGANTTFVPHSVSSGLATGVASVGASTSHTVAVGVECPLRCCCIYGERPRQASVRSTSRWMLASPVRC